MATSNHAVIYTRLSLADVLPDGTLDHEAVDRQERACRKLARARGWSVVEVVTDNDRSASRYSRKSRPGWADVLGRIERGEVGVVLAQHLDRITRQPKEVEHLIDLVEETGVILATAEGQLDLTTGDGRAMARVAVTFAAHGSDATSRRMRAQREDRARQGRPVRTVDGFGWRGPQPDPIEAEAIREAARSVIAGASLASVARAWNGLGLERRRTSSPWRSQDVRVVLLNPRHRGGAVYRGEVVARAEGPVILEPELAHGLDAVLHDPARARGPRRRRALSGVLRCGKCGAVMVRSVVGTPPRDGWRCNPSAGCGSVAVTAGPIDDAVIEAVLRALDGGIPTSAPATDPSAARELTEVDEQARELGTAYGGGKVGLGAFLAASEQLEARRAAAMTRLTPSRSRAALAPYGRPGAVRDAWPSLDEEARNVILRAVLDAVVIEAAQGRQAPEDRIGEVRWLA